MDNCWISCQVMADMEKIYDNLIIINLWKRTSYFIIDLNHVNVYLGKIGPKFVGSTVRWGNDYGKTKVP